MIEEQLFRDLADWPNRWSIDDKDLPYGRALLSIFREFIDHLLEKGLEPRTLRGHMDNLWLLGGELVEDVNRFEEYDVPPIKHLSREVDFEGGPLCRHLYTEEEVNSFDATCRKLHRYLQRTMPVSDTGTLLPIVSQDA